MPLYLDTSAIVPLLIAEPSSERCRTLWQSADVIVSSSLTLVEAHAALARGARNGRLDASGHERAVTGLEALWRDLSAIPPTPEILRAAVSVAASVAATHALRGYDAVQCATALALASDDLIAVSGDRELLRAWSELGVATVSTG